MLSPGKAASINARQWLGGVGSGCQWGHVRAAFPAQVSVPGCWRRAELVPGGVPLLLPALCLGSHSWLLYTCFSAKHFAELSFFCGMSHCCSTVKHPDLFYEIKREGQEVASPPLCSQVCPRSGFCRWNPSISNIRPIMNAHGEIPAIMHPWHCNAVCREHCGPIHREKTSQVRLPPAGRAGVWKPMVLRESQSVSCPWFARGETVVTGLILLPAEDCCWVVNE